MARRPRKTDPEILRQKLVELLQNFEVHLRDRNLRTQVLELVPANHLLRDLGSSLLGGENAKSARDRVLLYLKKHVGSVIHGDELMVVAGISEYARRIRELRVQFGWAIISGMTVKDMRANAEDEDIDETAMIPEMTPDQYMLVTVDQDLEAALRWNLANDLRKDKTLSIRDKILHHLRTNVGKAVNGEELRYVAKNKSEWARRTRELRTELGWPISTKSNGRPDLPVGVYVLENDRQSPPHDRQIKDAVRRSVMMRDDYSCRRSGCGWNHNLWNPSDPRHLEVHHIRHHSEGGSNAADNLVTYCNICHDIVHKEHDE